MSAPTPEPDLNQPATYVNLVAPPGRLRDVLDAALIEQALDEETRTIVLDALTPLAERFVPVDREFRAVLRSGEPVGIGITERRDAADGAAAAWKRDGYEVDVEERDCGPWRRSEG